MEIFIPEDIKEYEPELRLFMDLMVLKLRLNRHKGFAEEASIDTMYERLMDETKELKLAILTGSQSDIALESVDVSNMAWLLALVAWRMTKDEFERSKPVPTTEVSIGIPAPPLPLSRILGGST